MGNAHKSSYGLLGCQQAGVSEDLLPSGGRDWISRLDLKGYVGLTQAGVGEAGFKAQSYLLIRKTGRQPTPGLDPVTKLLSTQTPPSACVKGAGLQDSLQQLGRMLDPCSRDSSIAVRAA